MEIGGGGEAVRGRHDGQEAATRGVKVVGAPDVEWVKMMVNAEFCPSHKSVNVFSLVLGPPKTFTSAMSALMSINSPGAKAPESPANQLHLTDRFAAITVVFSTRVRLADPTSLVDELLSLLELADYFRRSNVLCLDQQRREDRQRCNVFGTTVKDHDETPQALADRPSALN